MHTYIHAKDVSSTRNSRSEEDRMSVSLCASVYARVSVLFSSGGKGSEGKGTSRLLARRTDGLDRLKGGFAMEARRYGTVR